MIGISSSFVDPTWYVEDVCMSCDIRLQFVILYFEWSAVNDKIQFLTTKQNNEQKNRNITRFYETHEI